MTVVSRPWRNPVKFMSMRRITIKQRLFIVVAAAVLPLALMSAAALYVGFQEQRVALDVEDRPTRVRRQPPPQTASSEPRKHP